ncbi:MAG: phosphatase PAP2 family protein [Flavobacteriales bacterium]|nr:phosphatase PAP2 family protein [Flavobacteriales bacterium]
MQRSRSIAWFLAVFIAFAAPLAFGTLTLEHLELHRRMHPFHSPGLDAFFRNATHLADGLVPTAVSLLVLVFRDIRSFLMVGLSCAFSAIVAQFLKRVPFADVDRPFMFKAQLGDLHWVEGVDLHHHLSFPSGHATAAFSMCLGLAVLVARPAWSVVLALLACSLAYSRVYLSQHFTEDILVGATLGTVTAYAMYHWLYRSSFSTKRWLDSRLLRR